MCEVYNVGPDELGSDLQPLIESGKYKWIVYHYENHGYDGTGELAAMDAANGLIATYCLGHCSCYGPLDEFQSLSGSVAVADYVRVNDHAYYRDAMEPIRNKVAELTA